ncbi:hypothetical protein C3941_24205 [Kaistia algarum]|uniref:hypothetical protein n=1 Tax=Kaistia algarum TaxID=2083279 RepID=UPI000CE836D1|nr:hypothetical protein [Kaistia algarum]MCX5516766.1 hypothetical protein [Kaistia algarum]PPE77356.1 hypothetical protein C3941_24205 [Kaistia algarum]
MINRRFFSALLAMCPAFVQRAFAARASSPAEEDAIAFLRSLRQILLEQAETRRSIAVLDHFIDDFDDVTDRLKQVNRGETRAVVTDIFDEVLSAAGPVVKIEGEIRTFDVVRPNLRPQIFATAYLEGQGGLLYRPFTSKSSVVIVEVGVGMNRFVRAEEADAWGLDFGTAVAAAVESLEAASEGVQIESRNLPGGGIVGMIGSGDGFDSSRALVPAFRRQLLSLAATPLQAAMPNRDILMFWTPGVAPFEEMRSLVREFYEEGPFSRTDEIFDLKAETFRPI